MGNAVLAACRDIQAQLRAMAARLHGIDEASITVERGVVRDAATASCRSVDVLKPGLGRLGGELIGNGEMRKEAEPDHPLGGSAAFFEFNCTAIEAEVDESTGDVTVVRHVTVSDVGKSINPLQVRMQDEGAAIQGLGHTLMEHYIFDEHGPDPEPRRHRLPDPDEHGPAARDDERHDRERRRARARTARRA